MLKQFHQKKYFSDFDQNWKYIQPYNALFRQVKWSGGKKFEDKFVESLKKYGYGGSYLSKQWLKKPAFIQSFAPTSLTYVSKLTDLPKIFLIDDITIPTQDTNQVCFFNFFPSFGKFQLSSGLILLSQVLCFWQRLALFGR